MKDYMAPMEGVTNYIYRNAYHQFYHPMDKYFTPFISAKPNKRFSDKEIREVSPENNKGMYVVPQILTNNGDDFLETARILKEDFGYKEVNLNLGCPSGTVTAKGKGAGFLGEPEKLKKFFDRIFSECEMEISVKTRIGTDYEEDWEALLNIYKSFPISRVYQASIPTCPAGYWMFGFASKKYHPLRDFNPERWKKRGIKTWYYTPNLHRGAFMLPKYIEDLLKEEENI